MGCVGSAAARECRAVPAQREVGSPSLHDVQPSDLRRRLWLVFVGLGVLIAALIAGSLLIAHELHDSAQRKYLDRVIPLRGAMRDLLLRS